MDKLTECHATACEYRTSYVDGPYCDKAVCPYTEPKVIVWEDDDDDNNFDYSATFDDIPGLD